MWAIKASGFVAGFLVTSTVYANFFLLKVLEDRVEQEQQLERIREKLRVAANSAMAAAPADLNAATSKGSTFLQ